MLSYATENRAEWQAKLRGESWWGRRNNMASEPEMWPAPTRADVIKYLQAGGLFDAAKAYLAVHPLDAPAYVTQQMQQGSDLVSDRGIPAVRTLIQFWEEDSHTDLPPEALEKIPKVFKLKLRFLEEVRRTLDLNEATKNYGYQDSRVDGPAKFLARF